MTALVIRLWRAPAHRQSVAAGMTVKRPASMVRVALFLLTVLVWGALLWGVFRHD